MYFFVKNIWNKVSLVKSATGDLIDIEANAFSDIVVDITDNYVLVDCLDGICKQTQGYVKDKEKSNKIYAFVGTGNANVATVAPYINANVDDYNDCGDGTVGIVINNTTKSGICYGNDSAGIMFGEGESRYIFLKGKVAKKTPFADRKNSVVVKRNAKYIVKDQFYNAGTVYIKYKK